MSTHTPSPPAATPTGNALPRRRWWLIALIAIVAIVAVGAVGIYFWQQQLQSCSKAADPSRSGAMSEYCPPDPYKPISGAMTTGPDGKLWYVDSQQKIVRFTPQTGALTETAAPTAPNNVAYAGIVTGSDGNIWYIANNTLGRINMNGEFKEFALSKELGFVGGIAAGPNGTLWVTTLGQPDANRPGALLKVSIASDATQAPTITEVSMPSNMRAGDPMAVAPDGSLWASSFVMSGQNVRSTRLVSITPDGAVTQLPLTIPGAVSALTRAPDGAMWLTSGAGYVARITQPDKVALFRVTQVEQQYSGPPSLAIGPDGNAWFTTSTTHGMSGIGRITPSGVVTTFTPPHTGGMISNITAGSDGGVWFILGYSQPMDPSPRLVRVTP